MVLIGCEMKYNSKNIAAKNLWSWEPKQHEKWTSRVRYISWPFRLREFEKRRFRQEVIPPQKDQYLFHALLCFDEWSVWFPLGQVLVCMKVTLVACQSVTTFHNPFSQPTLPAYSAQYFVHTIGSNQTNLLFRKPLTNFGTRCSVQPVSNFCC